MKGTLLFSRDSEESPYGARGIGNPLVNALLMLLMYGWCAVILLLPFVGYLGENLTTALSFSTDDGWCTKGTNSFGVHCFGDLGFPYLRGNESSIYIMGNMTAANSPLFSLLTEAFRLIDYRSAVVIYISSLAASILIVCVWATRGRGHLERALVIFLLGLGSIGSIAALDRGNHIAYLAPLTLGFIIAVERKAWKWAVVCLAIIAALKFWGILLVVALLAKRKFTLALLSVFVSGLLYAVPLAFFAGTYTGKLEAILWAVFNRDYGAYVLRYSVSPFSLLAKIGCWMQESTCDPNAPSLTLPLSTYISVIIAIAVILWAYLMLRTYQSVPFVAYVPLISLFFMAVPEAAPYNLVATTVMSAILVRWGLGSVQDTDSREPVSQTNFRAPVGIAWGFVVGIVVSTLPLPIWSYPDSDSPLAFMGDIRISNLLIPATWIILAIWTSVIAIKGRYNPSCQGELRPVVLGK